MAQQNDQFSSRWGIVLAALGMAVGTGNIWRFPRVAAANGGGAFLIAWLVFMFAWSAPLVIIEFALGKHTRRGPAGAIGHLIGAKANWMGAFVGVCTCFIMFYYSVVTGWCIKYFVASLGANLTHVDSEAYWHTFTTASNQPIAFHLLAMVVGCFIISRGVVKGIELTNRILIPILFLLLAAAAARALLLPGAIRGLDFLFTPDWHQLLSHKVWIEALSQSAWSVGAGWGLVMTYGVYLRKKDDFVLTSYTTAFGDYAASLLAGIAVMCTVFAVLPEADARAALGAGNEGLTFIWLPRLFERIPAGHLFLAFFFLALSFAAMSSLIAMIELATRMAVDLGVRRSRAVPLVGAVGFLLGLPSAWRLGVFQNQDWVWGLGLMVSGVLIATAVIRYGTRRFRQELVNTPEERRPVGRWFDFVITYLVPVEFAALMAWWFYQSAAVYDREAWWNPLRPFSVGTTVAQWTLLIVVLLLVNRAWAARVGARDGGAKDVSAKEGE
jgi:NSS family neurotransmitter:Na+ symporter